MVEKYIKIYLKRNIILALICATIVFIPLLIVSLIYDVLSYDLFVAFTPFPIALVCVLISFQPIIRFRKMIMQQESLYDTVFSDTNVDHLETTLYLSKDWLIWAGSCAIYKNHIQSIKHELKSGRAGSSNKVTITTADNKQYIIWCLSRGELNPDRFSQAAFRQYCGKSLENTDGYFLRDFTCHDEKRLCENCAAPHSEEFCFGFLRR